MVIKRTTLVSKKKPSSSLVGRGIKGRVIKRGILPSNPFGRVRSGVVLIRVGPGDFKAVTLNKEGKRHLLFRSFLTQRSALTWWDKNVL